MNKISQTLRQIANDLEHNHSMWTQGALARDVNGKEASVFSPNAVCWCSAGLMLRYNGIHNQDITRATMFKFLGKSVDADIVSWNDNESNTVDKVIVAFRNAAQLAEREGM